MKTPLHEDEDAVTYITRAASGDGEVPTIVVQHGDGILIVTDPNHARTIARCLTDWANSEQRQETRKTKAPENEDF